MGALTVKLQNAVLQLVTDHQPFLAHAREFCRPQVVADQDRPDVQVVLEYRRGLRRDHKRFRFEGQAQLDSLGYQTSVSQTRIDWNDIPDVLGLQLSHRLEDSQHCYHAVYHETQDDEIAWRLAKRIFRRTGATGQNETWDLLVQYLIYFPICWFLERERGLHLLHASCVELGNGAALFPGLAGVGKSTVAMYLFARMGARLLSDNLVLHDHEKVYACLEPILLAAEGQRLFEQGDLRLTATGAPHAHQRRGYHVPEGYRSSEAKPGVVLFLVRSHNAFLRQVSVQATISRILDYNAVVGETRRYLNYSAMMDLLSPRGILPLERGRALASLLAATECYEVGLQEGLAAEGVMEATILKAIERLASS
jgi:hypothetical protein